MPTGAGTEKESAAPLGAQDDAMNPGNTRIQALITIVAPQGQREAMLQALRSMVNPTRVEPGCVRCHLYEDVQASCAFTLEEEWATRADFERRLRSDEYGQLLQLMEASGEPPEIRFQLISGTMSMEAIHAARGSEADAVS
jgi:quinol monooxygenase YgiN